LIDIDNFFNNDVIMSSLLPTSIAQQHRKYPHRVTTADGCVHTGDADATQLDSWVASASAVFIGLYTSRSRMDFGGGHWRGQKRTFRETGDRLYSLLNLVFSALLYGLEACPLT